MSENYRMNVHLFFMLLALVLMPMCAVLAFFSTGVVSLVWLASAVVNALSLCANARSWLQVRERQLREPQ
jgi:hypothetical protein